MHGPMGFVLMRFHCIIGALFWQQSYAALYGSSNDIIWNN